LQALALRTEKTYVEHLPNLSRRDVELFVDVEGIPDRGSYYLIGLLACENGETRYHSFWANSVVEEGRIWESLLDRVAAFPDAPLYHYGSYERKAFESLAKRYGKGQEVVGRLVNVTTSITPFFSTTGRIARLSVWWPTHSAALKRRLTRSQVLTSLIVRSGMLPRSGTWSIGNSNKS
jgi:predicted RecB family nuclease